MTDDRSRALTQDQHAPVLPLALQDDVTSLSVCQQAAHFPTCSNSPLTSFSQTCKDKKLLSLLETTFSGGHQKNRFCWQWNGEFALLQGGISFYLRDGGISKKTWRVFYDTCFTLLSVLIDSFFFWVHFNVVFYLPSKSFSAFTVSCVRAWWISDSVTHKDSALSLQWEKTTEGLTESLNQAPLLWDCVKQFWSTALFSEK